MSCHPGGHWNPGWGVDSLYNDDMICKGLQNEFFFGNQANIFHFENRLEKPEPFKCKQDSG